MANTAKRLTALAIGLALALPAHAVVDAFGPLGTEFEIDTYTTDLQTHSSVATDSAGNFVVVWTSSDYYSTGQDGNYAGIFGQRFTSSGTRVGTEFQVNTYTTGAQYGPDVAAAPNGRFVVVWTSNFQDGDFEGVFGQRYDSTGARLGTEFQVNSYTTYAQFAPRVATDSAGRFVVVWTSYEQDDDGQGIFGQRFDSAGMRLGTEFQVNSDFSRSQIYPDVATDSVGRFVVVWNTNYPPQQVFGRRFDSAGSPLGTDFLLSDIEGISQREATVASGPGDGFVAAWTAQQDTLVVGSVPDDLSASKVVARQFDSAGQPQGSEFQVNTYTTGSQEEPAVAVASTGDFVVAWASGQYPYGEDGDYFGVFAQRFSSTGGFLGTEFQVNTYTTYGQLYPAIASGPNESFVITWDSGYRGDTGEELKTGGSKTRGVSPQQVGSPPLVGIFGQQFGLVAAAATVPVVAPALSPTMLVLSALALCALGIARLVRRRRV